MAVQPAGVGARHPDRFQHICVVARCTTKMPIGSRAIGLPISWARLPHSFVGPTRLYFFGPARIHLVFICWLTVSWPIWSKLPGQVIFGCVGPTRAILPLPQLIDLHGQLYCFLSGPSCVQTYMSYFTFFCSVVATFTVAATRNRSAGLIH